MANGDLVSTQLIGSNLTAGWTAATFIALDFGLDTTTVRGSANGRQIRADGINETVLHGRIGIVQSRLDNIVGKGVSEKAIKFAGLKHLFNQHILGRLLGTTEALLNDIGAELLLGELTNTTLKHSNKRLGENWLVQIQDVLNDVVTEWVLDENIGVIGNLTNEPSLLITRSMINASLEDTATVTMGSDVNAVVSHSIKDELRVNRGQLVKTLLNDMVAIEILNKLDNSELEGSNDDLDLARSGDELNHLLQSSSTMLIKSDPNEILRCIFNEHSSLVVVAVLQKLLAEIISERISHQLNHMLVSLKPDHMNLLRIAVLQFLLKIATAMLILAQSVYLST